MGKERGKEEKTGKSRGKRKKEGIKEEKGRRKKKEKKRNIYFAGTISLLANATLPVPISDWPTFSQPA